MSYPKFYRKDDVFYKFVSATVRTEIRANSNNYSYCGQTDASENDIASGADQIEEEDFEASISDVVACMRVGGHPQIPPSPPKLKAR